MKKLFAFMLCAIAFCASCNDDEDPVVDYADLLVGEWVYDHPEESVWETIKFTSSGMFYYSNSNEILYDFENENVNGRYFVDGDLVTGTYTLNENIQMNLDMQITKINELEFTAKFNDTGLKFTYARLLDSETVEYQETILPNYSNLLRNIDIIGYSSHNTNIAQVDATTGKVTGVSSGRTYIDIITSEGTAVVEIIVKGMFPYDFGEFIGAEKTEIYETFGNKPVGEEEDVIVYQNLSEEIQYVRIGINSLTGKVTDISIYFRNVDSSYANNVTEYLEKLYTIYEKGTTATYKAYINNKEFDKASIGITWDITNMQLTYVALPYDLFTDYSPFLGKTRKEVKSMMNDQQSIMEDQYKLAFGISDGKVDLVCCFYTFDLIDTYETVQVVITQLTNSLKTNEVHAYLAKKYVYLENESTNLEKVYLTKDGLVAIFYTIDYGQVSYYSNVAENRSLSSIKNLNRYSAKLK